MWHVSSRSGVATLRTAIGLDLLLTYLLTYLPVDRYLLPTGRSAANPPAVVAAVNQWDRPTNGQTDRRTDARPLHRPCSAYYVGSVNTNRCNTCCKTVKKLSTYNSVQNSTHL